MRPSLARLAPAVLGAAVLLLATPPASAQETSAEEGEALRAAFQADADYMLGSMQGLVDWSGEIGLRVEPEHYVLTFPRLQFGTGSEYVALPETEITLSPVGGDRFRARFLLPRSLDFGTGEGMGTVAATVEHATGTGLYDLTYRMFLETDIRFADLAVEMADGVETVSVRVDEIAWNRRYVQDEGDIYSGSDIAEVSGLSVVPASDGVDVRLDSARYDAAIQRMDLGQYDDLYTWLQQHGLDSGDPADMSPEDMRSFFGEMMSSLAFFDGMGGRYSLKGLSISGSDMALDLANAALGFKLTGLSRGLADARFQTSYDGLSLPSGAFAFFARYVPSDMDLSIGASDLPTEVFSEIFEDIVDAELLGDAEIPWNDAVDRLVDAMIDAGSVLSLDRFHLRTASASIDASGTVRPDAEAPFHVISNSRLAVGGLEELSLFLRMMADEEGGQITSALFELGEPETDAEGRAVRVYRLEVRQDGAVLVNGRDLMEMIEEAEEGSGERRRP